MKAIGNIYLSWRKGKGSRRNIVGVIKQNITEGARFNYDVVGVKKAQKDGFTSYTDFPDLNKEYKDNVLDVFGQRLTKSERSDIQNYYDFWEINSSYKDNKYYLLAHTQGLLATDNFEFLADYNPVKGLKFISEICSLSNRHLKPDLLNIGDFLEWKKEPSNLFDNSAILLFKGNTEIGYVKQIHNKVFYKNGSENLKIRVKSIEKNGTINRAFIIISF
jgi:hypothetical protein